jgi:hypothetical protein
MSVNESDDSSIEEQQQEYFLDRLPNERKGEYRCRTVLKAPPGATVLFQYRSHIIASATYRGWGRLPRSDKYGYTAAMMFDPATIRVFPPVGDAHMKRIWPRHFKRFSHAKQKLPAKSLPRFFALVGFQTVSLAASAAKADSSTIDDPHDGKIPTTRAHVRRGTSDVEVSRDHARMQRKLWTRLVSRYGRKHVLTECDGVDIRVRTKAKTLLFEIKPDESPRAAIRQALGQILEYAYFHPKRWNGTDLSLVIVGRSRLDVDAKAYLTLLADRFGLPISYRQVSP